MEPNKIYEMCYGQKDDIKNLFVSLTPSESKRLIAKAVSEMLVVKECMKKGKIAISTGSTTGFVVEELLRTKIEIKEFPCGVNSIGRTCMTNENRIGTIFIENGKRINRNDVKDEWYDSKIRFDTFGKHDLYIKGANAVDKDGNAGFLIAHSTGGNLLLFAAQYSSKRISFIIPVGLEKLVTSVTEAARAMKGQNGYDYSFGRPCGFYVVTDAVIVTEIEAINILCGAKAVHVSSGGIGGSEGSVTLSVEGTDAQIKKLNNLLKSIKGEKPVENWKMDCSECENWCDYPYIPESR